MVQLDPATYSCPTHGVDLTPQVEELLEEEGTPVAYRPWSLRGRRSEPTSFEVVVSCPGDGKPHEQACEGRYTP